MITAVEASPSETMFTVSKYPEGQHGSINYLLFSENVLFMIIEVKFSYSFIPHCLRRCALFLHNSITLLLLSEPPSTFGRQLQD
jgi:hypothetical protein